MIVFTAMNYGQLSETIPTHFNASGEADAFGDKLNIWLLPGIGVAMFVLLFVVNKYPHMHNYMVNITEDNALKNYRLSTRIVRFTNLFIMFIFGLIYYSIVESAKSNNSNLDRWILPLVIGMSIILPIAILVYQKKINK